MEIVSIKQAIEEAKRLALIKVFGPALKNKNARQ